MLRNATSSQLILNSTLRESLRSMLLFSSKFDRIIIIIFFTNEEDKRREEEQHSNLLIETVT